MSSLERRRATANAQLDLNQSLSALNRDYLDLYQVHNVMNDEDIDFAFGPLGVMEMIEKAKKEGKIRYVGFTGHMDPRVLKRMMGLYD
jgi:predicted aldo/keto reductase-like oxidoreductase